MNGLAAGQGADGLHQPAAARAQAPGVELHQDRAARDGRDADGRGSGLADRGVGQDVSRCADLDPGNGYGADISRGRFAEHFDGVVAWRGHYYAYTDALDGGRFVQRLGTEGEICADEALMAVIDADIAYRRSKS